MPKQEEFALLFYVYQEGGENHYHYKVFAQNEEDAIEKAPKELAAAEKQLNKTAHNPMLVKILSKPRIR